MAGDARSSFSLQPSTSSIIDELFDSISTDCDPAEGGTATLVARSSPTDSTDPAQAVGSAQDVSTATVACRELCEMSASMVESLATMDVSLVSRAGEESLAAMDVSLISRAGEERAGDDGSVGECSGGRVREEEEEVFLHHGSTEEDGGQRGEECERAGARCNEREGCGGVEAGAQYAQEHSPSHGGTHLQNVVCPAEMAANSEPTPAREQGRCGQPLPVCGEEEESTVVHCALFPGLATASGKRVRLSDSALSAARAVLHGHSPGPMSPLARPAPAGVSTSLENTLPSPETDTRSGVMGLQTASGKAVTVSEGSLRAARSVLGSDTLPPLTPPPPSSSSPPSYPGLQTASHKPVEVSRQALLQARAILDGEPPSLLPSAPPTSCPGLRTASDKRMEVSAAALEAVRQSNTAELHSSSSSSSSSSSLRQPPISGGRLPGLQTASGRRVEVSQSALEAARLAMDSSGREDTLEPVVRGLWTVGGSEVEVSQLAREDASSLTRDTRDVSDVGPLSAREQALPFSLQASAAVPTASQQSSASPASSSSGTAEVPQVRPSFRPAASTPGTPSQAATPAVRYKPVFKRNHQTQCSLPPSHIPKSLT